jgi:hypothetical protein
MTNKPIHAKPSLYAFYFEIIKEIGLKYGYNIVLHGSMNRDLDLIAIPWEENVGDKDQMIDEISNIIGGNILMSNKCVDNVDGDRFSQMPHGRINYIININRDFEMKFDGLTSKVKDYSDPQYYIDISILPTINEQNKNDSENIINYIENDAEIAIPIAKFFDINGNHITKKEYGLVLIKILCEELRERFQQNKKNK